MILTPSLYDVQARCYQELQSSEGLIGAGGTTVDRRTQFLTGYWLEFSVFTTWASPWSFS